MEVRIAIYHLRSNIEYEMQVNDMYETLQLNGHKIDHKDDVRRDDMQEAAANFARNLASGKVCCDSMNDRFHHVVLASFLGMSAMLVSVINYRA